MKKALILGLFLITSLISYPQRDGGYYYAYKGKISFTKEVDYDSITVKVPKPIYLRNPNFQTNSKYYFKLHFHEILLENGGTFFRKDTLLGPSTTSKGDPELYLHHVFIDGEKNYKLIIQIGQINYVKLIDITKVIFKIKGCEIVIEFPEIII